MKEEILKFLKNDEKLVNLIMHLNFNQLSFIDKINVDDIDCVRSLSRLLIIELKKEIPNKEKIEKILKKNKKDIILKALDFIFNNRVISIIQLLREVVTQSEFSELLSFKERKNIFILGIKQFLKKEMIEYADFAFNEDESKNILLNLEQITELNNHYSSLSFEAYEKGDCSFYNIVSNSVLSLKKEVDPKSKMWAMLLFSNPNIFTKKEKIDFIKKIIKSLRAIRSSNNSKKQMKAALQEFQIFTYDEIYSTFFDSKTNDLKKETERNMELFKITVKILSLIWVKEILKDIEQDIDELNCPFLIIDMGYISHKAEEVLKLQKMVSNILNIIDYNSSYAVLKSRFSRKEAFNIVYENRNINEIISNLKAKRMFLNNNTDVISFLSYYKESLQLKILNDFDLKSDQIFDILKEIYLKLDEDFEIEDFNYELVMLNYKS